MMPTPDTDVAALVLRVKVWATQEHRKDVLLLIEFLGAQTGLVMALAERVAAQSELLGKKGELAP